MASLCVLSCAGVRFVSFVLPAAAAQTTHAVFEVASVRPAPPAADPNTGSWSPPNIGRFFATHVSLEMLIQLAYGVDKSQIAGQPAWMATNLYDVNAKPEEGVRLSRDELQPRLQELLQQRFHLVVHKEMRETHAYALVAGKGGPHLSLTKGDHWPGYRIHVSPGQMRGANWTMPVFAKYLTSVSDFPVVDQTGLTGSYDIDFVFQPNAEAEGDLPPLGQALEKATGLMLKPRLVPVETIVIDSVEKVPTAN